LKRGPGRSSYSDSFHRKDLKRKGKTKKERPKETRSLSLTKDKFQKKDPLALVTLSILNVRVEVMSRPSVPYKNH